jgi:GNAT superfamily N-acetyltransferase
VLTIVEYHDGKEALCRDVLDDLPELFGLPEAKANYIAAAAELPMLAGLVDGRAVGFVSLKPQTEFAVELYVLGVRRAYHRRGIGRALIESAARLASLQGRRFLTVKTLAASIPDPNYAATRRFYETLGFLPLEIFPTLWDVDNPSLLMVKPL